MDITIDTTHPLNDRDRAILQALLEGQPSSTSVPGTEPLPTPHRPSTPEQIAARIAGSPRKPDGAIAGAKMPVAMQAGVSFTESTREEPEATAG